MADLRECPFCGGSEARLVNSWTAAYWIKCPCGAELHRYLCGRELSYGAAERPELHRLAQDVVVSAWNGPRSGEEPTRGGKRDAETSAG